MFQGMRGSLQHKLGPTIHSLRNTGNIEASIILSPDGLLLASDFDPKLPVETIASMVAIMRNSAEISMNVMGRGMLDMLFVETSDGATIVTVSAGSRAVVTALLAPDIDVSSGLMDIKNAVGDIRSTFG